MSVLLVASAFIAGCASRGALGDRHSRETNHNAHAARATERDPMKKTDVGLCVFVNGLMMGYEIYGGG